jgi:hypothetical protein
VPGKLRAPLVDTRFSLRQGFFLLLEVMIIKSKADDTLDVPTPGMMEKEVFIFLNTSFASMLVLMISFSYRETKRNIF